MICLKVLNVVIDPVFGLLYPTGYVLGAMSSKATQEWRLFYSGVHAHIVRPLEFKRMMSSIMQ